MKCKRLSDARAHDHHTLQVMRQQAVKAVRHGETADSVSKAMGVNIRTVFRWLADFSVGGQSALLAKPIPGRPTKETFPAIRAQAKKEGATIYFADESGLRSDYHKT
jgi:transposase